MSIQAASIYGFINDPWPLTLGVMIGLYIMTFFFLSVFEGGIMAKVLLCLL